MQNRAAHSREFWTQNVEENVSKETAPLRGESLSGKTLQSPLMSPVDVGPCACKSPFLQFSLTSYRNQICTGLGVKSLKYHGGSLPVWSLSSYLPGFLTWITSVFSPRRFSVASNGCQGLSPAAAGSRDRLEPGPSSCGPNAPRLCAWKTGRASVTPWAAGYLTLDSLVTSLGQHSLTCNEEIMQPSPLRQRLRRGSEQRAQHLADRSGPGNAS